MEKALFVHGFNGSPSSSTGKSVVKALDDKYEFIIPQFDLTNIQDTLDKIKSIIREENVKLLAGTSLGAFYVLSHDDDVKKLVVNPCMMPDVEIPNLPGNPKIDEGTLVLWKNMVSHMYLEKQAANVSGFFGDEDELFHDKYHKLFAYSYGNENLHVFHGGHHGGSDFLTDEIRHAF